jgi:hypothetical protein
MTHYPRKDGEARTGSNLLGEPLLAHRRAGIARETQASERLAKDYQRQSKKLFSKADLRRAAEIGREANREWREASINAKGDSLRIDELKRSARNKLERRFARELGGYRQWRTIQKAHLRAQSKASQGTLAVCRFPGANIDWGDVVAVDPGAGQTFVAPFTTFDVQMIDTGGFVVEDNSFAKPDIGHLVNNFAFDQDESTGIGAGLLGLLPIANATSMVSCGAGFAVPSAGRLKVGAVLRNFYNKLVFSVEDKFGFSSADVWVSVLLLVAVVRGTRVEYLTKDLQSTEVTSDGDDVHYAQSDLDTTTPYSISVETQTRYDANESVLVLAGSEVLMGTKLDDMHCKLNAVLWWKLEKLVIDMAVDVIT